MAGWTYRIKLAGVDITSRVRHGSELVEITENASGLMDCEYRPTSGVQSPTSHMLEELTLEVNIASAGWVKLFGGRVIRAPWNPKTKTYALRASTRMQDYFNALDSHAAVLAELPGTLYSDALFGDPPDDLWKYAELCMSTVPTAYWIDVNGALASAPWSTNDPEAYPPTADITLAAGDVDGEGAFSYERADAETLTNQVVIELDYSVQRKKIRSHTLSWVGPHVDLCDWWEGISPSYQWRMPWSGDVEVMASASGWNVPLGVRSEGPVQDGAGTVIAEGSDDQEENASVTFSWRHDCNKGSDAFLTFRSVGSSWPVWAASADGYAAITGQVIDKYKLTVRDYSSVAEVGPVAVVRRSGSLSVEPTEWPPAAPDLSAVDGWDGVDTAGDYYADDDDEGERVNMLNCAWQWGRTKIKAAARANRLTCRAKLRTDVTLATWVSISAYGITSEALKVAGIKYTMDPPRTELTLAVSLSASESYTFETWATPVRPDSSDPVTYWETKKSEPYPMPESLTILQTHVGRHTTSEPAPDPDERTGLITNAQKGASYDPDGEEYDFGFRCTWPGIEEEASAGVELPQETTVDVWVPYDDLEISA